MRCLDRFNQKMLLNGNSLREEHIYNSRELLRETFADDPSYALGIYFWEHGLRSYDGKDTIEIRLYGRRFSNANGVMVSFQTLYDSPVIVGDVLYDSKTDEYFICTESFDIDGTHWKGKLALCNWILKWQDGNGDIFEYPCRDQNATQYNSGEKSGKQMTIGSSQHMVTLPYDDNTVILKSPQRFFLDRNTVNPTSYIVTQNDTTSYNWGEKGIVCVTVLECAGNNETDRIDLGICDYVDPDTLKKDNADDRFISKSVISYSTSVIKSGGDSRVFIAQFFDKFGKEIDGQRPVWDVVCDFKDVLDIVEDGDCIRIGIDNDDYVDEEFKLVLSDEDGNNESSIIVKIGSLL